MQKKIIYYILIFRPGGAGCIKFRLEGENQERSMNLTASDFSALAALLAQKNLVYEERINTFFSYDDDTLPHRNEI